MTCQNRSAFGERTQVCVVCVYKVSRAPFGYCIAPKADDFDIGGFPMPNPSADSVSTYALKPDFSFAFKEWIAGGIETLMWSFRGT